MKRKKKRKFQKPKAGLKAITKAGIVGYAGGMVRVSTQKGLVYEPLRYTVLTCSNVTVSDKDYVDATLKPLITGPDVMTLPDGENGWACQRLDLQGRAILVLYKGIECALYYKRQLTEVKLQPGDHYPEGILQDPAHAWQRLDLLGRSAKQQNIVLKNLHDKLEEENDALKDRVETQEQLNASLETQLAKLTDDLSWFTPSERLGAEDRKRKYIRKQKKLLAKKERK